MMRHKQSWVSHHSSLWITSVLRNCTQSCAGIAKHLSAVDRKTLPTLKRGWGSWARNFKSYSANNIIEKTTFNVTGSSSRHLCTKCSTLSLMLMVSMTGNCLTFHQLLLDDLDVPMPPDTPDLLQTFLAVYDNHHDRQTYTLEGDACQVSANSWQVGPREVALKK